MKLTPLQLECMKLGADKTLSFGCIFLDKFHRDNSNSLVFNTIFVLGKEYQGIKLVHYAPDFYNSRLFDIRLDFLLSEREHYKKTNKNEGELKYEIVGHPITYGRLWYLFGLTGFHRFDMVSDLGMNRNIYAILNYFKQNNISLYDQTILERPEDLILLVRDFLLSITKG